jgi:hypothetical protein
MYLYYSDAGRYTKHERVKETVMLFRTMNLSAYLAASMRVAGSMRALGPYAVVALVVPGGCLIALLLWAFRNRAFLMGRVRRWQDHKSAARQFDPELNRIRLDRITRDREAAHTRYGPPVFAPPANAMVFLRAGSAAESQRQERRRDAGQCVRI